MRNIKYKNYYLSSASKQTTNGLWTTEVVVTFKGEDIYDMPVSATNLFETKEEADKHSILLGQTYVDEL